jgi:hypothetical protein
MLLYSLFSFVAALFGLYRLSIIVYRLFWHPLRYIPGPRVAATTTLYETYYDLVKGGRFSFKVRDLHTEYGSPL